MTPKLSVIVPVYNSARFMSRGIEKILSQSMTELELICVDDCSNDNSAELIKSYMAKDARVRGIFLTENGGSAAARNAGLAAAQGEYIGFVDSDDYPTDDFFYKKLLETAYGHDADIVKGTYRLEGEPPTVDLQNARIQSNKHNFIYHFFTAIFRKAMLDRNEILFPNVYNMEDPPFALHAAIHANSVIINNEAELIIVPRQGSKQRKSGDISRIKDMLASLGIMVNLMNTHDNFPKVCYIHNFVFYINSFLRECNKPGVTNAVDILRDDLVRLTEDIAYKETIWAILRHFSFSLDRLR